MQTQSTAEILITALLASRNLSTVLKSMLYVARKSALRWEIIQASREVPRKWETPTVDDRVLNKNFGTKDAGDFFERKLKVLMRLSIGLKVLI